VFWLSHVIITLFYWVFWLSYVVFMLSCIIYILFCHFFAFSALDTVGWVAGRASGPSKNMGDGGGGRWLVQMEWRPAGWSVCLPLLISPCTIKSRSSLLALAHPDVPGKKTTVNWRKTVVVVVVVILSFTVCCCSVSWSPNCNKPQFSSYFPVMSHLANITMWYLSQSLLSLLSAVHTFSTYLS